MFNKRLLVTLVSIMVISNCSSENKAENKETEKVEHSWTNLLADDGMSLWKSYKKDGAKGWGLEDGVLYFKSDPKVRNSHLLTKKSYMHFELKFEFKTASHTNSGIKYRTKGLLGLEYQIIDDSDEKYNKKPIHRTAAIYGLVESSEDRVLHPVGQWNTGRILADGNTVEHWLNGEKVTSIEYGSEEWAKRLARSKYKGDAQFGSTAGSILLQDHNDTEISFRNLLIREIPQTTK